MNLKEIDGTLNITIDQETIPLQMNEIVKENTFFTINKSLNTPIYSYIDVDLLLERSNNNDDDSIISDTIDEVENIEEDNIIKPTFVVEKGYVTLIIRNIETNKILYENQITFYNGIIKIQIPNELSLGTYLFEAHYTGNKYCNGTSLLNYLSIEKREIKCVLDTEYTEGYPNENVNIGATFKDVLTDIPISNCKINYNFNNIDYTTQTDKNGHTLFNVTVPNIIPYRCSIQEEIDETDTNTTYINEDNQYYIDESGNLQFVTNIYNWDNEDSDFEGVESTFINDDTETEDIEPEINILDDYYSEDDEDIEDPSLENTATYKIYIDVDDDIYYSTDDLVAYVHNKVINTEINFIAVANNNGMIHIEGDVISNDTDNNVEYGYVIPTITNINIVDKYEVNEFGHFNFDVRMPSPIDSTIEPTTFDPQYEVEIPTKITLTSNTEQTITRDWANKHYVDFTAKVTSGYLSVNWSMVTFIVLKGNKEIYRHVTELNNNGEAFFSFNVSALGNFKVKAIYHGMFGYLTSTSETYTYTVTGD